MTETFSQRKSRGPSEVMSECVIVGAGPYGLSLAAHLTNAQISATVLGKPLGLWQDHMPDGMQLRSSRQASSLSDPSGKYSLARYFEEQGHDPHDPFLREHFIAYGLWFQRHLVPQVDETFVTALCQHTQGFRVTLADGRVIVSPRVVLAHGLAAYASVPMEYSHLPKELVSHSSRWTSLTALAGRRIAVLGGGQSALELAALAQEAGADVHLITRRTIQWLPEGQHKGQAMHHSLWHRLRYPQAGIGEGLYPWALEHFPYTFYQLPRSFKMTLLQSKRGLTSTASAWLKPRVMEGVSSYEAQQIERVLETDHGLRIMLPHTSPLDVDHLILSTGYRVNVHRLSFLDPTLLAQIQTDCGAPHLTSSFESTLPGLFFIGFSSLPCFGPLYRFVLGVEPTARRVTEAILTKMRYEKA